MIIRIFKNRRARRVAALPVLLLWGFLMFRWYEHRCVFQPSSEMAVEAGALGRAAEDVFIPVDKGGKIEAWYFPANAETGPASRRVILVCHGNAGNISHRLELCQLLLETGASVMVFDYRGYGRSPGWPNEENTCRDAQAACQWLRQKGFAATNIVGYGESLGGGVAAELALREPLGGVILQSTFTSVPDLGAQMFPWLPVRLLGAIKYDTVHKLPRLIMPVLILHSREDTLIPFAHAERNFAAAREPKTFREMRGDHNDAILTGREEILTAVNEFLGAL
jgi:fermentation-respiration switch protein FrsA (DUF1100 family)